MKEIISRKRFDRLMMTRRFLLIFLVAIVIVGCDSESKKLQTIISEKEFIAVVNNKKISLADFQKRVHLVLNRYQNLILGEEQDLKNIKNYVVEQMIVEELILQEASRKGVEVSEQEQETLTSHSLLPFGTSKLNRFFKQAQMSDDEWKESFRQYLLQLKLLQKEVIEKIPITKREILNYYRSNRSQFVKPRLQKVRHIAVSTFEEASAIRTELKRHKSFVQMVKNHSITPDKAVDGDLGYVAKGEMPPELEKAIFKLRSIKEISPVVQSQHGFHLFRLEKTRRKRLISLKEATPIIRQKLINKKLEDAYKVWIEKLKNKASISVDQGMLASDEGF